MENDRVIVAKAVSSFLGRNEYKKSFFPSIYSLKSTPTIFLFIRNDYMIMNYDAAEPSQWKCSLNKSIVIGCD